MVILIAPLRLDNRFWSKVDRSGGPGTCWPWQASKNVHGYGQFHLNGTNVHAHIVAYRLMRGPYDQGLELDHLCRRRECVNPNHLEPVTRRTNQRRGVGFSGTNAVKTHCPQGHAYSPDNTHWYRGTRRCATCRRAYRNALYARTGR